MVLIDRKKKKIVLLELTCSLPQSTASAHNLKQTNYTQLKLALEEKGYAVCLLPFEVGSNGHITSKNKQDMSKVLQIFNVRFKTQIFTQLAQISLLCSMSIFYAYQTTEWISPPLLSPWPASPPSPPSLPLSRPGGKLPCSQTLGLPRLIGFEGHSLLLSALYSLNCCHFQTVRADILKDCSPHTTCSMLCVTCNL